MLSVRKVYICTISHKYCWFVVKQSCICMINHRKQSILEMQWNSLKMLYNTATRKNILSRKASQARKCLMDELWKKKKFLVFKKCVLLIIQKYIRHLQCKIIIILHTETYYFSDVLGKRKYLISFVWGFGYVLPQGNYQFYWCSSTFHQHVPKRLALFAVLLRIASQQWL